MDTPLDFPAVPESLLEQGFPANDPPINESDPPGSGSFPIPHFASFSEIANYASRTYRWSHDQALKHSRQNALAIRNDPVVMQALRARQLPVVQLPWHLEGPDDEDAIQTAAIEGLTKLLEHFPQWQRFLMHLQEALWFGRYGVQLAYEWKVKRGRKQLTVRDHQPINGDKLVFKFSGQAGVLVHATFPGKWDTTERGRAHFFTPSEREQVVIHSFEPEDSDFYEGELSGARFGVGIRSRIYWLWWLRSQVMAFLLDYLERVGAGGLTIFYYEHGNPESFREVKAAAEQQHRNTAFLFPRRRDVPNGGPGVQRVEPSQAGAQLLQSLIVGYFDDLIEKYILGQSLSHEATSTGLGSGVAELHGDTFARLVKYDAVSLQETITKDLVHVLQRYNYPKCPPLRFVFDIDRPNALETAESAQLFYQMGGAVSERQLREVLGLEEPQPNEPILAQMQSMQPAALGAMPEGVPVEAPGGPQDGAPQPPMSFSRRKGGARRRFAQRRLQADPRLLQHANGYLQKAGLAPHEEWLEYPDVDPGRGSLLATTYDKLPHAPHDPRVARSYDTLKKEVRRQFEYLKSLGVDLRPWLQSGQPYGNSKDMIKDARGGKLDFYTGGDLPEDHPLAEPTGLLMKGRHVSYNDLFRAVHDYFGHALYGNQFGARGEEAAYQTHKRMFTPEARPSLANETRGQNSWVNFGPHGEHNRRNPSQTIYAPQKANVLPEEHI